MLVLIIGEQFLRNSMKKLYLIFILALMALPFFVFAEECAYFGSYSSDYERFGKMEITSFTVSTVPPVADIKAGETEVTYTTSFTVSVPVDIGGDPSAPYEVLRNIQLDVSSGEIMLANGESFDYTAGTGSNFEKYCKMTHGNNFTAITCSNIPFTHIYQAGGDQKAYARVYVGDDMWACQGATVTVTAKPSECPNGKWEEGEECDGTDFGGKTCENQNLGTGTLVCTDECKLDTSGCTGPVAGPVYPTSFRNPLIWDNILAFLKDLVIYIFRIGTGLSVLMILIGAFVLVISRVDPEKTNTAKRIIFWAIIGFATTMLANGIIALLQAILGVKK